MPSFGEFQQAVAQRIQDSAAKISQASVDGCIEKAIKGRYSQERPLEKIKDLAGDGVTFEWEINTTNFPGWVDEASYFTALEYPAGEKTPIFLDTTSWLIVRISSSVRRLRLLSPMPQTGKTLRITYTVPHSADKTAGTTTVAAVDFEAIADLAAAYACVELAAAYNQLVDPAFAAPTDAAHQTKSQHYLTLAKKYEAQWAAALGLDKEAQRTPATGWATWDDGDSDFPLTH